MTNCCRIKKNYTLDSLISLFVDRPTVCILCRVLVDVLLTVRYNAEIPESFPHVSSYVLCDSHNVIIYLLNIY